MGRLLPITSVFPSTTVAALTTLWTGCTPGEHGFLGSRLFLPEYGVLANMLRLAPAANPIFGTLLKWGFNPEGFLPVPSLAQRLDGAGVQTVTHLYGPHIGDGLARIFLRGVTRARGHIGYSDMWINARETLLQRPQGPLLVNVYWTGMDDVGHTYGPDGERFASALRHLGRSLQEDLLDHLPLSTREGTLLVITADHGQITTPPSRAVRLSDHPALQQMLWLPPAGETRASYLYVRPGEFESLDAYVEEYLSDRFVLLSTEEAVSVRLFGGSGVSPLSRSRLGDAILLARGDSQLISLGEEPSHLGHHGSLTQEEMLVPLLMVRLDSW
jgi:predicted AlkP superfamily pyrophosphatase or phosphodiesterase